jgi:hypothetical protein
MEIVKNFDCKNIFILLIFFQAEWVRLRIPSLLRTFWLTRMSQQLISIFVQGGLNSAQNSAQFLPLSDPAAAGAVLTFMLDIGRDLIIRGAETIICLLGMTRYDI